MATPETSSVRRKPGRPSSSSRDDVVKAALDAYLHGRRIDLRAIATELGISRTTIYRWFGSRERLIGEILVLTAKPLHDQARDEAGGEGAERLLATFDRFNRAINGAGALRHFVAQERDAAVRIITDGRGVVQPSLVAWITEDIVDETERGAFEPQIDPPTLGYAIVRLAEAFLFIDTTARMEGDVDSLCVVEAALLGFQDPHAASAQLANRAS